MKKHLGFFSWIILLFILSFNAKAQNDISFSLSLSGECEPVTVNFNNNSIVSVFQGTVNYKWYLNGEDLYFGQFPPESILNKGKHNITLEVTDDLGTLGVFSKEVEIKGIVDDFMIIPGTQVCPGEEVSFITGYEPFSVEWDFGDGNYFNQDIYSLYPRYRYFEAGTYTVNLVASNSCGTDTVTRIIEVTPSATPEARPFIKGPSTVCPNEEISFGCEGNFKSYLWDFGDGNTSTLKSPKHVFPDQDGASYQVNLTVWNHCGGSASAEITASVQADVPANAAFHWQNNSIMDPCPNTSIKFTGESSGFHQWYFGDGGYEEGREVMYSFAGPGDYELMHIVNNTCGNTDSLTENIVVSENVSEVVSDLSFHFDVHNYSYDELKWLDTLTVCRGELVELINTSHYENNVEYEWDFGDNVFEVSRDASHRYTSEGEFTITLTATTACGGTTSLSKYVKVVNSLTPASNPGVAPLEICPGEQVFFYDDEFHPDNDYTYSIEFGDGNTLEGIKDISNTALRTLAQHQYTETGTYNFTFIVENSCGTTKEHNGSIIVTDDVQVPFYYVTNSSISEEEIVPQDWSEQKNESDHEFIIPVKWTEWQPSYSDSFYVFFWYGGLNTEHDPGTPDGYLGFQSSTITEGEILTAWIPMNLTGQNSVGMAFGYFCPGELRFGDEPEVWTTLIGSDMEVISNLPLEPSGSTNITDHSPNGLLITSTWDGICSTNDPEGRWYKKIQEGVFAILELYHQPDEGKYFYNMYYQNDPYFGSQHENLSSGEYLFTDLGGESYEVEFMAGDLCGENGRYTVNKNSPDFLKLDLSTDPCNERTEFLTGEFTRWEEKDHKKGTCPGDPVKFIVAGGESYQWDFGDGNSSEEQNPIHIYSDPGDYIATLTATNACGRTDEITSRIRIAEDNIPVADFYIENFDVYVGDSALFRLNAHEENEFDPNSYHWDLGDGRVSDKKFPVHIYSEPGEYMVGLTVSNACGEAYNEQLINVLNASLDCDPKFTWIGNGLDVSFTDISSGGVNAWEWDFGDGNFSNLQNPAHSYTEPGVYHVMLTIFDDRTNCVSYTEQSITVGNVNCISGFDYIVNPTLNLLRLTNTSLNADTYYWEFGDGEYSVDESPQHFYRNKGNYKVCLTITNASGDCQDRICKEIFVDHMDNSRLKADFSSYSDAVGTTLSFQDLSTGSITNWYWTMGDGKSKKERNFEYTYAKPGYYDVCLNVFNEATGASDEICKQIKAGDPGCTIEAYYEHYVSPLQNKVRFSNKSVGTITGWYWNFGDGNISEKKDPVHSYEEPGMYLVTLSVRDEDNNCMDQFAGFIQVGKVECNADFHAAVNADEKKVHLFNRSTGPVKEFYWDLGNGSFSREENPTVSYKKAGTYEITLTIEDSTGTCMDEFSRKVQVGNIDCSARFEVYVDSVNARAYFSQLSTGEASAILWSFGDGSYSSDPNPVHKYTAQGYYTVGLNIYNNATECMDYYEEIILISGKGIDCKADFMFKPSEDGSTVFFMDNSQGNIVEWLWNFGDGFVDNSQDPTHFYGEDGYYLACLTVTNNVGVRNMKCKWIPIEPNDFNSCRANFMFTVDSVERKVKLKDDSYGEPDLWFWSFGDGNTSTVQNPVHQYAESGYYLVTLSTYNSTTGCKSRESRLLNVGESYILKAAYTYDTDTSRYKADGYPVDFVGASSGDGATYEWDFGDNKLKSFIVMDSSSRIVRHYYQRAGIYNACLRVTDPVTGQTDIYCDHVQAGPTSAIPVQGIKESGLEAFPNPARDYTYLKYNLQKTQMTEISIYDVSGNRIQDLVRSVKPSGEHELLWDVSSLTEGIYLVKLIRETGVTTLPVMVVK